MRLHSPPDLHVGLRASRALVFVLVLTHAGAIICLLSTTLPVWLQAGMVLVIIARLLSHLRRDALLRSPNAVVELCLGADGGSMRTRDGRVYRATGVTCRCCHECLISVSLQLEAGGRRAVILLADAADPGILRQLRVRLRNPPNRSIAS